MSLRYRFFCSGSIQVDQDRIHRVGCVVNTQYTASRVEKQAGNDCIRGCNGPRVGLITAACFAFQLFFDPLAGRFAFSEAIAYSDGLIYNDRIKRSGQTGARPNEQTIL